MYKLEKKPNVYVGYSDIVNRKFQTLEELIDFCFEQKLFNEDVKKEDLKSELDVDWYLTNLVTKKMDEKKEQML